MKACKSPRRVLQSAYEAACQAVPPHRHELSPKKFTQLLAWLVLKGFSRLDYRGSAAHLAGHPDLCALIALKAVPHYTTFQRAAQRLPAATPGRRMFDAVLERALKDRVRERRARLAAVDGTGMESHHVGRYSTKRQADGGPHGGRTYAYYPKAVFAVDCAGHMILSAVPGRGPANDLVQFGRAWSQAARRARIETLVADRTSTPSGCTCRSARTACGRSSRGRRAGRRISPPRGGGFRRKALSSSRVASSNRARILQNY